MDFSTIIGLIVCVAAMVMAIVLAGGSGKSFISVDAFLIVGGGTIGSTMINLTLYECVVFLKEAKEIFVPKKYDWLGTVKLFTVLANEARREGVLSLQNKLEQQDDPIIRTGLQLIVDGVDSEILTEVLKSKIQTLKNTNMMVEKTFARMAALAPGLGLLGCVSGLIMILANLSDADKLGAGVSQAMIATFYGIFLSNIVFLPMSGKTERNNTEKNVYYQLLQTGLLSLQEGDNPFLVEEKLKAFCPEYAFKQPGRVRKEGKGYEAATLQTEPT
jgi:chemotaxis protein MotA